MKSRNLGYIAVAVALISVSSWLAVPIGDIPITLQTAVICALAGLLGVKRATLSVLAYILLGLVGVPVFAGFSGGIAKLLLPTGGYILGFLPLAATVGLAADLLEKRECQKKTLYLALAMALGTLLCYALGTVWFVAVVNGGATGLITALTLCVLPYLPFDLCKIVLATFLAVKLKKFIKIA